MCHLVSMFLFYYFMQLGIRIRALTMSMGYASTKHLVKNGLFERKKWLKTLVIYTYKNMNKYKRNQKQNLSQKLNIQAFNHLNNKPTKINHHTGGKASYNWPFVRGIHGWRMMYIPLTKDHWCRMCFSCHNIILWSVSAQCICFNAWFKEMLFIYFVCYKIIFFIFPRVQWVMLMLASLWQLFTGPYESECMTFCIWINNGPGHSDGFDD